MKSLYYAAVIGVLVIAAGCRQTPQGGPAVPTPPSHTSDAPSGLFEDVTERAGIRFQHTNGEPIKHQILQTTGGGCAFLDFDGDGNLDILLLSPGDFPPRPDGAPCLALYRNRGDGTFEDVTRGSGLDAPLGCYAQSVSVGDYDNDGYPDIFVAGYGGCRLFHQRSGSNPKPQYADVTAEAGVGDHEHGPLWASSAAWGDYDNDGRLDLYLGHYMVWSPETDKDCHSPDGTLGVCPPVLWQPDRGRLFHNEGNGKFRDVTHTAGIDRASGRGLGCAWMDYDGDGRPDLYVANDLTPNLLWHNVDGKHFQEIGQDAGVSAGLNGEAQSGMGIAAGDYDNTGRESLVVTNLNYQSLSLFRNQGGGQFLYASAQADLQVPSQRYTSWGVAFVDLDRDGWPDLVTANGNISPIADIKSAGGRYKGPISLYHNKGQGQFVEITEQGGATTRKEASRGMAVGDFDNDGRMDLLVINRNTRAELFRNVSADKNQWIMFRLVGVRSNRDGAGARVWVKAGNRRTYAECRLSSSYASSCDKRLHFGLGSTERVDEVVIKWPSGHEDRYTGLAAGRNYVVTEGKGYAAGW